MATKQLLFSVTAADCRWDYYRGSGKGGQARNKTENCVRCTHIASGAVAACEDGRSKDLNKREAFRKMCETATFKKWHKIEVMRRMGTLAQVEEAVERQLEDAVVEAKDENGRWVDWDKRKPDDEPAKV